MSLSRTTATVTTEAALALVQAARAASRELGFPAAAAVADAGGVLRAFLRDDEAPLLTAELAVDKAWSAVAFGLGTHVWNEIVRDPAAAPLALTPRLTPVEGGLPLRDGGRLVGGLGVSGGRGGQDAEAARRALAHLGFEAEGA